MSDIITEYGDDLPRPEAFTREGLRWEPWVAPLEESELTDEHIDAMIDPLRAKNPYFRLLARDPAALKARTLTDLDIFFNVEGGVGRAERELAASVTSRHNGCVYCASVHTAAAVRESGREDDVDRLIEEGVDADLGSDEWNAIAHASVALADTPLDFGPEHLARLRDTGFDDAEILDVLGGAAFFNWANRLMLSLGEPSVPPRRR